MLLRWILEHSHSDLSAEMGMSQVILHKNYFSTNMFYFIIYSLLTFGTYWFFKSMGYPGFPQIYSGERLW